MAISDDELVRRLESMPMVDSPDFRDAVMSRIPVGDSRSRLSRQAGLPVLHFRKLALGLAWAAAVAIVIGIAFFRPPSPQSSSATMAASDFNVVQSGERFLVKAPPKGTLEFDETKLAKTGTMPDGTVILQRKPGATGRAEIVFHGVDGSVLKTSVAVN